MADIFQMRPVRETDKDAILAFCAHTWDWGDYLENVWDAWRADPRGMFAAATLDGQVVGVDKLTFLSADEAFFEGLRVDPAYRGQGIAGRMEEWMLAEAARQGARVIRLITAADNTPVHKNTLRHGFRRGPEVILWEREAGAPPVAPLPLIPLTPGPAAEAAWAALRADPLWAALDGLMVARWRVQAWTPALWAELLAAGQLWVTPTSAGAPSDPSGLVALRAGRADNPDTWLAGIAAHPCDPPTLAALIAGAQVAAGASDPAPLQAMLPALPALDAALRAAGWTTDGPDHAFFIFEKTLES